MLVNILWREVGGIVPNHAPALGARLGEKTRVFELGVHRQGQQLTGIIQASFAIIEHDFKPIIFNEFHSLYQFPPGVHRNGSIL